MEEAAHSLKRAVVPPAGCFHVASEAGLADFTVLSELPSGGMLLSFIRRGNRQGQEYK